MLADTIAFDSIHLIVEIGPPDLPYIMTCHALQICAPAMELPA